MTVYELLDSLDEHRSQTPQSSAPPTTSSLYMYLSQPIRLSFTVALGASDCRIDIDPRVFRWTTDPSYYDSLSRRKQTLSQNGQIDQESLGTVDHPDCCGLYVSHVQGGNQVLTQFRQTKSPAQSRASSGPKSSGISSRKTSMLPLIRLPYCKS